MPPSEKMEVKEADEWTTVKLKLHTVRCVLCNGHLTPPIYQFEKEYLVTCRRCQKSSSPTWGSIQNHALEMFMESLSIPCSYSTYGCNEYVPYFKASISKHEMVCSYAPQPYFVKKCSFEARNGALVQHLASEHHLTIHNFIYEVPLRLSMDSEEQLLVLKASNDDFLLINNFNDCSGRNKISLVRCSQSRTSKKMFSKLVVRSAEGREFSLKAPIEQWKGLRSIKVSFDVPVTFCGRDGKLDLEVHIHIEPPVPPTEMVEPPVPPTEMVEVKGEWTTVKLKLHILRCALCNGRLIPPVYQFEKGFLIICGQCHKGSTYPRGFIRNHALEKVIESLSIPCSYSTHGCNEYIPYLPTSISNHEKDCSYEPHPCLVEKCAFKARNGALVQHLTVEHRFKIHNIINEVPLRVSMQQHEPLLVLKASDDDFVLINNFNDECQENNISVVCCSQSRPSKKMFSKLVVRSDKGMELSHKAPIERWKALYSIKVYFDVPVIFRARNGKLDLEVHIYIEA